MINKETIILLEKPNYKRFQDLDGLKFTRWTVLGYAGKVHRRPAWWCECSCEKKTISKIPSQTLLSQASRSCGCFELESKLKHGKTKTPEFKSYQSARRRCVSSKDISYPNYGGRGVEFRFNSFQEFYEEVGERPEPKKNYSLDRIDSNKHYERGNLRWATRTEQQRNTRSNFILTVDGQTKILEEWSELSGINRETIARRIKIMKWCDYCAVTIPTRGGKCLHV